ncbi:hypothetical protein A464_1178 [Salmonella bongori N268-08]|uniref:Uncharacterized protein n=1 Tax=Salmonella bongori N268-08 TaxID=1197719 RepID=S5MUP5_SALBN|nr:hypothetical protein A464_1178 [Salmonella bongori N268-08]
MLVSFVSNELIGAHPGSTNFSKATGDSVIETGMITIY